MKKYENPEINISLFDIEVATTESATAAALAAFAGDTNIKKAEATTWSDWTISF